MPSPFPGMDPYIESAGRWPGFHALLLTACQEQLLERLPAGYDVEINEQVKLVDLSAEEPWPAKTASPDLSVTSTVATRGAPPSESSAVATLEPIVLRTPDYTEVRERWIEIRTQPEADLVTAIEILSPSNKVNPGFGEHIARRAAFVHSGVNVLDLDLLTIGTRPEMMPPIPPAAYAALLFRAVKSPLCEAFVWGIRDRLPTLPVPLKAGHADIALDLASAFATSYDRRRYHQHLPYASPLKVRLEVEDLRWAEGLGRGFTTAQPA